MFSLPDNESPWGESDFIVQAVVDWLEAHDPDWDWGFAENGEFIRFKFRDHGAALLFKLAWGGL
jgi:hypothetical protein